MVVAPAASFLELMPFTGYGLEGIGGVANDFLPMRLLGGGWINILNELLSGYIPFFPRLCERDKGVGAEGNALFLAEVIVFEPPELAFDRGNLKRYSPIPSKSL